MALRKFIALTSALVLAGCSRPDAIINQGVSPTIQSSDKSSIATNSTSPHANLDMVALDATSPSVDPVDEKSGKDMPVTQEMDNASADDAEHQAELSEAFKAVFKSQIETYKSLAGQDGFYLLIANKQPDRDFLKAFIGSVPEVKSGNRPPNSNAIILKIENWKWISNTEVEVSGGYYHHPLSASDEVYTLKLKDGLWIVVKVDFISVS